MNPATHLIYVTSRTGNTVSVLDPLAGAQLKSTAVGVSPFGVAVNRITGKVYVANFGSSSVSVLDLSGNLLKTISVGGGGYGEPSYVGVNETTNRIYVTLHAGGALAVIDGATDTRLATADVCGEAFGIAVDAASNRVYVSCRAGNSIEAVDGVTNAVLPALHVALSGEPFALGWDPARRQLYVAFSPEPDNPRRLLGYRAWGSALQPMGYVDVGNGGPNGGGGIAVNEATGHAFVTNSQDGTVSVLDGATFTRLATVPAGDDPMPVAADPSVTWAYVGDRAGNAILALPDIY